MWLQSNHRCQHALALLKTTAQQIARMIARVTSRRRGMKEGDTLRLVRSLVVSRVTYSLPYYNLTKAEKEKADVIIKMAYKTALRLPKNTPNEKLLALGLHNTFEELAEAQLISQKNRLLQTPTGRSVLERLGYNAQLQAHKQTQEIPRTIRSWYQVTPLPKNMDPNLHPGRRQARAQYIERKFGFMNAARFTDAALYTGNAKKAVAVVTDCRGTITSSGSISPSSITEAEEVAIALAIQEGRKSMKSLTILTDSQTACRNFQRGRVGTNSHRILTKLKEECQKEFIQTITWVPGHEGITGNLHADRAARGYANYRALNTSAVQELTPIDPDYSTILNYYRGNRMLYPPPHRKLKTEEATDLRRLQTGTFVSLHKLHKIHPSAFRDMCPWCGSTPTLYHITWECTSHNIEPHIPNPNRDQWEALLASSDLEDQILLVRRANRLAEA
ncbi:uncharacterized protein LOC125939929, partial [Dermacentor silvarum]|uniref:uncharacterized protein LOC125939929 n=1 Tax=Dermacentor silvarum TaxID=543639 RepID=UPI0021016E30